MNLKSPNIKKSIDSFPAYINQTSFHRLPGYKIQKIHSPLYEEYDF